MTPVENIFRVFLSQIGKDIIAELPDDIAEELMLDYLRGSTTMFNTCTKDLSISFDEEEGIYAINSNLDLDEIYILANGMIVYWLKPKIYTLEIIKMGMTDGDFSKKSTAPLLGKLIELKKMAEKDMRRQKVKYSYKGKGINE